MTVRTSNTPAGLQDYLNTIGQAEHPVLAALRERTLSHRLGNMAIAREQAALLSWLAQLIRVEKIFGNRRVYRIQQHRRRACIARAWQSYRLRHQT